MKRPVCWMKVNCLFKCTSNSRTLFSAVKIDVGTVCLNSVRMRLYNQHFCIRQIVVRSCVPTCSRICVGGGFTLYRICRPARTHSRLSQLACVSVECRLWQKNKFLNQACSRTMNTVGAAASTWGYIYVHTISIVKPARCTSVSNLFYFGNDTLHVSDGLSVRHPEFQTVRTYSNRHLSERYCCLLASNQTADRNM